MKAKRIKPIANHAEKKEQDAIRIFVAAQKDVENAEVQLQQLLNYRDEYAHQLMNNSFNAERLRDYQMFIAKINQAIDQAKIEIENRRRVCEIKKNAWLKSRTRSQALNLVVEKYELEENRAQERREQKNTDEYAARAITYKKDD